MEITLVCFLYIESETRPVDPQYASGNKVKFTDCFQFLLISQASLDAVNEQLKEPVSINRFRPKRLLCMVQLNNFILLEPLGLLLLCSLWLFKAFFVVLKT